MEDGQIDGRSFNGVPPGITGHGVMIPIFVCWQASHFFLGGEKLQTFLQSINITAEDGLDPRMTGSASVAAGHMNGCVC